MKKFYFVIFKFIVAILFKKIKILEHNGKSITDYPTSKGWFMVPFPMEKGIPFNADNLASVARCIFLQDERFIAAQRAAESRWGINPRDITWRLDILLSCVSHALKISDEKSIMVECGTGRGYMAAGICEYFKNVITSDFYLFDTFISEMPTQNGNQNSGINLFSYADGDSEIKNYFSIFPHVHVVKGRVPDSLLALPDGSNISFLHLDLNNSIAEEQALNALIGRIKKGGIILFDDYGGFGGEKQAEVHERFANKMNNRLFTLPTGQAIYIHV